MSDNRVGSASGLSTLASDAQGGGIMSWLDALTNAYDKGTGDLGWR